MQNIEKRFERKLFKLIYKFIIFLSILFVIFIINKYNSISPGLASGFTQSSNSDKNIIISNSSSTSLEKAVFDDRDFPYIGKFTVSYIVDGDTVHVKDNLGKFLDVRLLAVNTLEIHATSTREKCFAEIEKRITSDYLLGKNVYLYGDRTQPKFDKYGRTLAYINIEGENGFFNDYLIRSGNARMYIAHPEALKIKDYRSMQAQVIKEGVGMWSVSDCR